MHLRCSGFAAESEGRRSDTGIVALLLGLVKPGSRLRREIEARIAFLNYPHGVESEAHTFSSLATRKQKYETIDRTLQLSRSVKFTAEAGPDHFQAGQPAETRAGVYVQRVALLLKP